MLWGLKNGIGGISPFQKYPLLYTSLFLLYFQMKDRVKGWVQDWGKGWGKTGGDLPAIFRLRRFCTQSFPGLFPSQIPYLSPSLERDDGCPIRQRFSGPKPHFGLAALHRELGEVYLSRLPQHGQNVLQPALIDGAPHVLHDVT